MTVYAQLYILAKKGLVKITWHWKELSKIELRPDELFQDFVSQLMTTVGRHLRDSQTEHYLKTVYMVSEK